MVRKVLRYIEPGVDHECDRQIDELTDKMAFSKSAL